MNSKELRPHDSVKGVSTALVLDSRSSANLTTVQLAQERAVALVFNGISYAVMMATPCDLEDFAVGFAFSEGFISKAEDIRGVDVVENADGVEVQIEVSAATIWRVKERRRTLSGATGCGLCGVDSLEAALRSVPAVAALEVSCKSIVKAQQAMTSWQPMRAASRATHAAAWANLQGDIVSVREDVGRHNALDKLIGARIRQADKEPGFVCVTSRASFEMVQKSLALGSPLLAAVSAPTDLAVRVAKEGNLVLVGFVRGDDFIAYTYTERLQP